MAKKYGVTFTCPLCKGPTFVKDTRVKFGGGIRRRRGCADCGQRFTTIERLADDPALVPVPQLPIWLRIPSPWFEFPF